MVSSGGITALTNGNYVVSSRFWGNGNVLYAGAATFGNGTTGIVGSVSAANSLVGTQYFDVVSSNGVAEQTGITALANGNYVVNSTSWKNGSSSAAGAATFGNGATGVTGPVNSVNSGMGLETSSGLLTTVVDEFNGNFYARFVQESGGRVRVGSQVTGFAPPPKVAEVRSFGNAVTSNERLVAKPSTLAVSFSQPMATSGPANVLSPLNWRLTRDGVDITTDISGITGATNAITGLYDVVVAFTSPLSVGTYILTARDTVADTTSQMLDGDANGTEGGNFTRGFRVSQLVPVGNEVQVNTTTSGNQQTYPDVSTSTAMDATGNYVVTWTQAEANSTGLGIYGQRYNVAGQRVGSEFQINVTTNGRQERPAVAMDSVGDFVVAWMSQGEDGNDFGIYARRYNAAGNALATPFRVNTFTTGGQYYPHVAMRSAGEFLITWSSFNQLGAGDDIFGRRYDANGTSISPEFQINVTTAGDQYFSKTAYDAAGNFLVTWQGGNDGNGEGIFARRFLADGTPLDASDVLVNTNATAGAQQYPAVGMTGEGKAVITWSGPDASGSGVYAKLYSSLSDTVGAVLTTSTTTAGDQKWSTVAMDADGDFAITWTSGDASGDGIFAQIYAPDGTANGGNIAVNTTTADQQRFGTIAMDSDGDFVINWSSNNQDGSGFGIYARRYSAENFTPVIAGALANQAVNDNATKAVFSSLTVVDPNTQAMTATIRIVNGGVRGDFTPASSTGWVRTVIGNNIQYSRNFSITANIGAVVQAAIRAFVFQPRSNAIKPSTTEATGFTVTVSDGIATPVSESTSSVITTSVNNTPLINGASATVAVSDNATVNPFPTLTVSDADNQEMLISVTILNGKVRGDFINATSSGWTVRYTTGNDITYKRYFSPGPNVGASAQAAFRALVFQPRTNAIKPVTTEATDFQVTVSDGFAPAIANRGTRVTTTSVNNAPAISGAVANQTMTDNQTKAVFNTLTVTDPDNQDALVRVTITNGVNQGDFTSISTTGWTRSVSGSNIVYTRYFNPAVNIGNVVQTAIRTLVFQPRTNIPVGTTETTGFNIFVNDGLANTTNSTTSVMTTGVAPRQPPFTTVATPPILASDTTTVVLPSITRPRSNPLARLLKKSR